MYTVVATHSSRSPLAVMQSIISLVIADIPHPRCVAEEFVSRRLVRQLLQYRSQERQDVIRRSSAIGPLDLATKCEKPYSALDSARKKYDEASGYCFLSFILTDTTQVRSSHDPFPAAAGRVGWLHVGNGGHRRVERGELCTHVPSLQAAAAAANNCHKGRGGVRKAKRTWSTCSC